MRILGAIFSTRAQRAHDRYMREIEAVERVTVAALETARAEDLAEQLAAANAKLLDVSESLEDMKAEAARLGEEAAAGRLRNADLQRRLDATLQALDKARDKAEKAEADYKALDAMADDLRAAVANAEMDGPKRTLEKANDAQAARAMSRNTKQAFVVYQRAVAAILDQIDTLGQKNHITKEDLRKLRQLRSDLSDQIQRTI